MTTIEFFPVFAGLSSPLFIAASMLAIGLSLTITQFRRPRMNLSTVSPLPRQPFG